MNSSVISIFAKVIKFIIRQYNKFIAIPILHSKLKDIAILASMNSIQYIIDNRCSVSRFGDGEFDVLLGKNGNTFQTANAKLAERLKHILVSNDAPNHMVGIPRPLKGTDDLRPLSRDFWGYYIKENINYLLPFISKDRIYLDTQLSRFYMAYKDKSHCKEHLALLKKIWDGRDIVIVEGCESRTGVGNDLYDNAKSIRRIIGLATNAFEKYDDMLNAILTNVSKDKLVLLSYGMCATVLAYDLAKLGYWAIDLGHLDIEYEWMRMGVTENSVVKGKFTNEAGNAGRQNIVECIDPDYQKQIIFTIAK